MRDEFSRRVVPVRATRKQNSVVWFYVCIPWVAGCRRLHCQSTQTINKNSSGDEIANVNFYAVRNGSYPNSLK